MTVRSTLIPLSFSVLEQNESKKKSEISHVDILKKIGSKLAWPTVGILFLMLVFSASVRFSAIFGLRASEGLFAIRYLEHPIVASVHMITGITFLLLAPLQFSKKFRNRNFTRHRILGRVLLACAFFSGLYGLLASVQFPAFGGVSSLAAVWFFGAVFTFSIVRSLWCARNKKIAEHREWMIRTFAIGLGVGTQRLLNGPFLLSGYEFIDSFGPTLWLGFATNLLIAETWINLGKKKSGKPAAGVK